MKKLKAVGINDIENIILLADDVLKQIQYNFNFYDEEGYPIYRKCSDISDSKEQLILTNIIRSKDYTLDDAINYSAEELIVKLQPIRRKILGTFRNGAEQDTVTNDTNFYADETVSDEYLLTIFAMRLRDRMILMAAQR